MNNIFLDLKGLMNNDKLTPKEQLLTNYILENYDKIVELNIADLANESNTSSGTILRLVKNKLGFDGFTDFKQQLIKENSQSQSISKIEIDTINKEENFYQYLLKNIVETAEHNILKVIGEKIYDDDNAYLKEFYYELLENSDNIVVFDQNDNFGHSLSKLLMKQNYVNKYEKSITQAKNLIKNSSNNLKRKKRVLERKFKENLEAFKMIDFSSLFSEEIFLNNILIITAIEEYSEDIENLAEFAQKNGFKVILIFSGNFTNRIDKESIYLPINLGGVIQIEEMNYKSTQLSPQLFLEGLNLYYNDNFTSNN